MTRRMLRERVAIASLVLASAFSPPARAQDVDPAAASGPYQDGAWLIGGARAELDDRGSYVEFSLADFGGQDTRAWLLQGQAGLDGGFGVVAGYAYSLTKAGTGEARTHLYRLGATWARPLGGVEIEIRALGEVLAPESRAAVERGRLRLRVTAPLVGSEPTRRVRLFAADELFVERRGITRNRLNLGLRGELEPLQLDLYWLREDRDDGRAIDAAVVQTTLRLTRRR